MGKLIDEVLAGLEVWRGGALGPGKFTSATGTRIDFFNPRVEDVPSLEDLLFGLSNQCRWGGQTPQFYSVAQHSLWVSHMCFQLLPDFETNWTAQDREDAALAGLVHDIEEGIAQDLIRPVKYHMGPEYRRLAEEWRHVIHAKLGLANRVKKWHELVRVVDDLALSVEDHYIRGGHVNKIIGAKIPEWVLPIRECMTPAEARAAWLVEWNKRSAID